MNNPVAKETIVRMLQEHDIPYDIIQHQPARTSLESAAVRASAGFPGAVGAKALIVKCDFKDRTEYVTLVLPSALRIDGRAVRTNIAGLKKFRFLTVDEMHEVVQLSPGCMPPFGPNVFEKVSALYIDPHLKQCQQVGFNVADIECSIVLALEDYLSVASPTAFLSLSTAE